MDEEPRLWSSHKFLQSLSTEANGVTGSQVQVQAVAPKTSRPAPSTMEALVPVIESER